MTICVLPREHVGLCGRFPVVVITWCAGWRDVISIVTSLRYWHKYVFCDLTWGHISGAKIGRFQLLLSKNAVYTRFIPSPRPRFWDVVSRQLIEQGSSHRGHIWRVFQVLKLGIVRWDGFFRKDGLVSALFSEIDAFWWKDLKVRIHRLSFYLRRWVARSAVPLIKLRILAWNVAFLWSSFSLKCLANG